jgi:5,10-methylenetetrahydrofolate reductase
MNTDRAQAAACCWAWRQVGAASVVAMNQNPRQVKRTARKLAKGAEHAVTQLDEMVSGFVERKMDL